MNRRKKIIISATGIFLVTLILVGLTYGYFLTYIQGNQNKTSISFSTSNIEITWVNGSTNKIESNNMIMPGEFTKTMDFQVKNTGDDDAEYDVILDNYRVKWASTVEDTNEIVDTDTYLEYPSDMELIITCKSYDTRIDNNYNEAAESGTCSGKTGYLPTTNDVLVFNQIPKGKTHVYELILNYKETGKNQSADMNKTIEGLIDIRDPKESADIEGYVANYNEGDYVQSNSTQRISSINKNGYYKILGLEFDNHTISVKNKEKNTKISKDISIKKGIESGIEDTELTVTNEERIINIDIDVKSKNFLIDKEIKQYNPYKEGTLVAEIINNAQNTTLEEESTLGYAFFRKKPTTIVAEQLSKSTESELSMTVDDHGTTYYYRGRVKNNYLNFAGMCWRIMYIKGDGSVKLILEDKNTTCDDTETTISEKVYTGEWNIGQGNYGYDATEKFYDGRDLYKMSYLEPKTNADKSMVKAFYDFQQTFTEDELEMMKSGDWCMDNTAYQRFPEQGAPYTYKKIDFNYDKFLPGGITYSAYTRLMGVNIDGYLPTLKCLGTTMENFKNVEGITTESPMYVGAMTADELVYAGGRHDQKNTTFYIKNSTISSHTKTFWLNSFLSLFESNDNLYDRIFTSYHNGELAGATTESESPSFRPSIVLQPNIKVVGEGIGTIDNPYVIN